MKKLLFTIALSLLAVGAFAQKKVLKEAEKAFRKGEMESAIDLANQATKDAETGVEPDVYILLGDIYKEQFVTTGLAEASLAQKSLESYQKAMEVGDDKVDEDIMEPAVLSPEDETKTLGGKYLGSLEILLLNRGNVALEAEDFDTAYKMLRLATMINTDVTKDFFVAYAADNADVQDVAIEYYRKVTQYDEEYDNKNYAFSRVIQSSIDAEEYDDALAGIRRAQTLFPEDDVYRQWEVDILIKTERMDEAITNLQNLLSEGSTEKNLYYMLAYLQWNNEDLESAKANAMKALEIDPDYAEALYVAGSVLFNEGAEFMTQANSTTGDEAKYESLKKMATDKFQEALPMFEKAIKADPNDVYSLRPLSTIYDQLGMDAKRDEILDRLDKLEGGE